MQPSHQSPQHPDATGHAKDPNAQPAAGSRPAGASGPASVPYPRRLELLGFDRCPNTPTLAQRLSRALVAGGWDGRFESVDLSALPTDDRRLGYGAPTVLVDGQDLFGQPPNEHGSLGCRFYPAGLPDEADLLAQLRAKAQR